MARRSRRALLGLGAALLLIAVIWLVCNLRWADDEATALPAVLQPRAVKLAPEGNAFFDQQGLFAPPGESPNARGRQVWSAAIEPDKLPDALARSEVWNCKPDAENCVQRWRRSVGELRLAQAAAPEVGRRCVALLAAQGFEEPLRELQSQGPLADTPVAEYPFPQFRNIGLCMRWFAVEAVLAADPGKSRPHWERANALMRLANAGSQSLLGQVTGWSWAEKHWLLLSQWVADQPPGTGIDPAWGAPLSPASLTPQVWMVSEHHHQRQILLELSRSFERRSGTADNAFASWFYRQTPGLLPNASLHGLEARWLAEIEGVGKAQGAELARRMLNRPPSQELPAWRALTWRNPVGSFLNQAALPDFRRYLARQADLVLLQSALGMVLAMDEMAPAERAQWLARQALDDDLRRRLSLEPGGLVVRSWRSEVDPERAKPLRLPLRPF